MNHGKFSFKASNIDDVLNYHNDLLNNCLKDCMLTTPDLVRIVNKLMVVCVTFSNFIQVNDFSKSKDSFSNTTSGNVVLKLAGYLFTVPRKGD